MKIIKNLKYFLMLGCLSLTTFTFAETTANQDADKKAVQKQLSKKLNDLSIHIKTLENMLKNINVNDINDMKNRLDNFDTSISDLRSDIEKLPDNLENMLCNGTPDLMNGYVIESGSKPITYGTDLITIVNYRKWSNGYLEQFGRIRVSVDGVRSITLPFAYVDTTNMNALATRSTWFDITDDAGLAVYIDSTNQIRIEQGGANCICTFYVFGYVDVNTELEKPHRHMHGYVVDAGIIEQDHDGNPETEPRKVMYRKWNDGWLEQHGKIYAVYGENPSPIVFPYEYKDKDLMNIQLSESRNNPDSYIINMSTTNITTSGFSLAFDAFSGYIDGVAVGRYYFWKAEGYVNGGIELKNTHDAMYRYVCEADYREIEETGEVKWYRKWSDGWLEQGGTLLQTSGNNTVLNFDIPFKDTSYTFTATSNGFKDNNATYDYAWVSTYNKSTTNLTTVVVFADVHGSHLAPNRLVNYYACGKAASTNE